MQSIILWWVAVSLTIAFSVSGLHASSCYDERGTVFVGRSYNKTLFAIKVSGDWEWIVDYCHTYGMFAASIDNEDENDMVACYLNSTSDNIDSLWLPATDYITEGTFAWVRNKLPVGYANWADGHPSISRSRNCLAIRKNGKWTEENCASTHYGLCELPRLSYTTTPKKDNSEPVIGVEPEFEAVEAGAADTAEAKIIPIGGVGSKLYFKDEKVVMRKMHQSLDFCHVLGMRLVSPETAEEFEFLGNYSRTLQQEGEDPNFLTSGSDMLAIEGDRSNARYRWFYSDQTVELDGEDDQGNWWYQCVVISPSGLFMPDCIGMSSWTLCELNTATRTTR